MPDMHTTQCCPESMVLVVTFCLRTGTYRVRSQANPAQMELWSDAVDNLETIHPGPKTAMLEVRAHVRFHEHFLRNLNRGAAGVTTPPPAVPGFGFEAAELAAEDDRERRRWFRPQQ